MTRVSFLMRTRLKDGIVRRNAKYSENPVITRSKPKPKDDDDGGDDDGGDDDPEDNEDDSSSSSDEDSLQQLLVMRDTIRHAQNTIEYVSRTLNSMINKTRRRHAVKREVQSVEDVESPSVEILSNSHFGKFHTPDVKSKGKKKEAFSGKGHVLGSSSRHTGPRFTEKKVGGGKLPLPRHRPLATAAGPGFEHPTPDTKRVFLHGSWVEIPALKVFPENRVPGKKHPSVSEKTDRLVRGVERSLTTEDVLRAARLATSSSSVTLDDEYAEDVLPKGKEPD